MQQKTTHQLGSLIIGAVFTAVGAVFGSIGIALFITFKKSLLTTSPYSTGSTLLLPLIFTGFGVVFLGIGLPFLIWRCVKKRRRKALLARGDFITATCVNVVPNSSVSINGRHPYVAECHFMDPATGVLHVYHSDDVMYCPRELIGQGVRVYIDPYNDASYYVALEESMGSVVFH